MENAAGIVTGSRSNGNGLNGHIVSGKDPHCVDLSLYILILLFIKNMYEALDPNEFTISDDQIAASGFSGYYLGKKIPLGLLKRAMGLPGKALAVYITIWFRFGIEKTREVRLERKFFEGSGMAPTAITRGINALVDAWLVEERLRKKGATPVLYLRTLREVEQCEEALAEY